MIFRRHGTARETAPGFASHTYMVSLVAVVAAACSSSPGPSPDGGTPSLHDAGSQAEADLGSDSGCTPKTGYEQVVAADPTGTGDDAHVSTVLDGLGNPMMAYVEYDMSGNTLYFTAYDGTTCTWKPRVAVANVGPLDSSRDRQVTLARDPASGRLGLAYLVQQGANGPAQTQLMLSQSVDGGETWTSETVGDNNDGLAHPTVAMQNGTTYFAYVDTTTNLLHLSSRHTPSGAFMDTLVPPVGDNDVITFDGFPPALAIDANGNAGLAMFAHTSTKDENQRVEYYALGATQSVAVFDSLGTQNDGPDVSLTFEGTQPRIAAQLKRGDADSGNSGIWFSASGDGTTWSAPVEMPLDGGDLVGPFLSLAANGRGSLTIAEDFGGSNGVTPTCGGPKVSTSSDDGASWTTCGPVKSSDFTYAGTYVQIAYAPNGKRIAGFGVPGDGVWIWREP